MSKRVYKTIVVPTHSAFALTESGGATPTNTSHEVHVAGAYSLSLQVQNGSSTNMTAEVFTSPDNVTDDDQAYGSVNLGANQEKTIPITVGPVYVKVKITNGDDVNATVVTTKLTVTR